MPVWQQWLRSWWVLLTLGWWINWTAFVYAGLRARRPRWLAWAGVYFVLSAFSIVFLTIDTGPDDWKRDAGAWVGIFGWAVSFVHALGIRKEFLDRVEAGEDPRLDAAEDRLRRSEVARRIVRESPRRARRLGIGRPDLRHSFDAGLIDVNSAPVEVVAQLPDVNRKLAERIVEIREEINGFSSLADFGQVLDLDGHHVDRLREVAVFLPR